MTSAPVLAAVLAALAPSARQDPQEPYAPFVAPASEEGRQAIAGFELAAGFELSLWAAEPRLANPVCLYVDHGGDVFVAETFRHHAGVTDIRDHMDWLDDDLASRTVADRVAMFERHLGEGFAAYSTEHERVRLLRDVDGDGQADFDAVFADGFSQAPDGIGAGLLSYQGDVWFTCIPHLWRLRDNDDDQRAEQREAISSGYGIRVALLGHDLHGLRIGPDGRLYFTCGDRGFTVRTKEGELIEHWDTGAVLRCELDGSHLEVFATGLRNPQELAFDDHGNLFTGDNNSDSGDRARLVHVVEGGDSGWRQAYQWLTEPNLRGPWNAEKLWHPAHEGQAAYIVPPIANLADGPSGFTSYPGTGFGPEWRGRFLLVDFRGAAGISGIHSFDLSPAGASFELGTVERFLWKVLATDADFGPDGALWVLDWVEGWNKTGKGRIYRVVSIDAAARQEAAVTQRLLAGGMRARPVAELAGLLAHADRRVRQEAQLALVARGDAGVTALDVAAQFNESRLARLHAIWGLGIAARTQDPRWGASLLPLLAESDPLVRAQAARALGDAAYQPALFGLQTLLADGDARVQLLAAIALGRLGSPDSVDPLVELLRENDGRDPTLRHGAVQGLLGCAEPGRLVALVGDPSAEVRLGAVVALRRLRHLGIVPFLTDRDPRVALEAARAVYDAPIEEALPALASRLFDGELEGAALMRRVMCAAWRLGGEERAQAIAAVALDERQDELVRWEALDLLGRWVDPPGRDPLSGEWRPVERDPVERERAPVFLARLVGELGERGIGAAPGRVVLEWLELVRAHGGAGQADLLTSWARDVERPAPVRARSVRLLGTLRPPAIEETLRELLFDPQDAVRAAAVKTLAGIAPDEALPVVEAAIGRGGLGELRAAYDTLAQLASPAADERLGLELDRLEADLVPEEVALDLVAAAESRDVPALQERLETRAARREGLDATLAPWLDALHGGDAERGRRLFLENQELTCVRCHRIEEGPDGPVGGQVGPDLRGIAQRLSRLALLESVVEPNRRISEGYRSTVFLLDDDSLVEGRVEHESAALVRLRNAEDELVELETAWIAERREGLSAMPTNLTDFLSRAQLRDLIAFLSSL